MIPFLAVSFSSTLGLAALIVVVIVLWIITSLPLWLASKALVHDRSQLSNAMAATLVSSIIFVLFSVIFSLISPLLGLLIGFIGILLVLMGIYKIGAARAFILAIMTFIVFLILSFILTLIGLGVELFHPIL